MTNNIQILLVEDNRMDVELALHAFREKKLPNKIFVVNDGQEALDYVFGRGPFADRRAFPTPNLILLDLHLPRIDGFEVLRQLKSTPGVMRLPVVVLTSSREDRDLALSYEIGANSYLVKPVSFEGFLNIVQLIVSYWLSLNIVSSEV